MPMAELDTRVRILDAAETLFTRQGFGATSMREITGAAEAPYVCTPDELHAWRPARALADVSRQIEQAAAAEEGGLK